MHTNEISTEELQRAKEIMYKQIFGDVYTDLVSGDFEYLQPYWPEWGLFMVYESLIYFLTHEEYDKCAFLRHRLNDYLKTIPKIPFTVESY